MARNRTAEFRFPATGRQNDAGRSPAYRAVNTEMARALESAQSCPRPSQAACCKQHVLHGHCVAASPAVLGLPACDRVRTPIRKTPSATEPMATPTPGDDADREGADDEPTAFWPPKPPATPPTDESPDERPDFSAFGKYQVLRRVGGGTFGDVYLCHDPKLGRVVAVKALDLRRRANPTDPEDCLKEARVLA